MTETNGALSLNVNKNGNFICGVVEGLFIYLLYLYNIRNYIKNLNYYNFILLQAFTGDHGPPSNARTCSKSKRSSIKQFI